MVVVVAAAVAAVVAAVAVAAVTWLGRPPYSKRKGGYWPVKSTGKIRIKVEITA